jgi:tetratricopeptide (TPR) repeat protein
LTDEETATLLDEVLSLPESSVRNVDPTAAHQGVESFVRSYVTALLAARLGRSELVRESVAELRRLENPADTGTLGPDLALSAEGYDAFRSGDYAVALERFEGMRMQVAYPITWSSELYTLGHARYLRGMALQETGQGEEAIRWYATLISSPYELVLRGPMYFHRGRIYEESGDRDRAAAHYRMFVDLWKNADPELQPMVEEARAALQRLGE